MGSFRLSRELVGLAALFLAVFTLLALVTYSPGDYAAPVRVILNKGGRAGAAWGGFLVDVFGLGAFLLPPLVACLGLGSLTAWLRLSLPKWFGALLLSIVLLALLSSPWGIFDLSVGAIKGGGYIGQAAFSLLDRYLGRIGGYCLLVFALVAAVQLTFGLTWDNFWRPVMAVVNEQCWRAFDHWQAWRERRAEARRQPEAHPAADRPKRDKRPPHEDRPSPSHSDPAPLEPPSEAVDRFLDAMVGQVDIEKAAPKPKAREKTLDGPVETAFVPAPKPAPVKSKPAVKSVGDGDALPPLDLLTMPPAVSATPVEPEVCRRQAESLITCLNDFGIQGEVQRVVPGPVVTMFEVKPAPGVKISRIVGLSVDLALSMKALAVRIEGPIPGKDTVGVEIPNANRQTVYLREILDADAFRSSASKITLAIGKDIQGRPQVADLARMPHLLVAGATGSGKSVCINGILLSILYKATPAEVKLLLVDPKRIELSVYNDLPHLVHPVVTETAMAKSALDWAVAEMDRRYESMALLGVRNIAGYNEKLEKLGDKRPEDLAALEPLPYLVIIIDELADLMMTAAKEVEVSIVRLAQLARAAGIHLVLATQRPSVDVVTGLIKANFPTRISFQVTSKHDSRTILDAVGAEYLLGRGDMLFKPSGGKTTRMHGAFVSDEETAAVVEYWKSRAAPNYSLDFSEWQKGGENGGGDFGGEGGDDTASDAVYPQAVDFVMEQGKASISLIQRRFRIGFNRAARFIEQMERDGLLGPQEGSKPRSVIKGKD
jgi:S-DNA-T family DNA segregation ATPase FtsK/SpoIIIE